MSDFRLYEIAEMYINMMEIEDSETRQNALDQIEASFEDKAGNITQYIKELEAYSKNLKEAEESFKTKRTTTENKIKWLKTYLYNSMKATGKEKLKAGLFNLSIAKNAVSVNIIDETKIPEQFFKIEKKPMKTDLKKALEEGMEIEGVELTRSESLRIK